MRWQTPPGSPNGGTDVIAQPMHLQRESGMLRPSRLLVILFILSILGVVAQAAFA